MRRGRSLIESDEFEPIHSGQRAALLYPKGALRVGDRVVFVEVTGKAFGETAAYTGREAPVMVTDVNPVSMRRLTLDLVSFARLAPVRMPLSAPADDGLRPGDYLFQGPAGAMYIYRELSGETDTEGGGESERGNGTDAAGAGGGPGPAVGGSVETAL